MSEYHMERLDFPDPLDLAESYTAVLNFNQNFRSPEAVIQSVGQVVDVASLLGADGFRREEDIVATAREFENNENADMLKAVHNGVFLSAGLRLAESKKTLSVSIGAIDIAEVRPLVPVIRNAGRYALYLEKANEPSLYMPAHLWLARDVLDGVVDRVEEIEALQEKCIKRHSTHRKTIEKKFSVPIEKQMDNFRTVLPVYFSRNLDFLPPFKKLWRRLLEN